jgi:8-oxo-dGTP pyrophosphatase MutT (NUDIX family)
MAPGASVGLTDDAIIHLLQGQALDPSLDAAFAALRPASVLVPLLYANGCWSLLFTRRTETVNSHKGQVSFPGGAADQGDASPEATALREAFEEIGLMPEDVSIFGRLASRATVSSFLITPVVGRVRWPGKFQVSPQEVSRLFTIPLDWLADPANWEERPRTIPGGYYEKIVYYQPYDGEILWGITARITLDLLAALRLIK